MLPDNLVPAHFHIAESDTTSNTPEKDAVIPAGEPTAHDYQASIMCGKSWAGQTRNVILEERDRHIKERLHCVVKIETFARVLNDLVLEQEIKADELKTLISEKTVQINEAGDQIWLNLITREKNTPFFYQLEE